MRCKAWLAAAAVLLAAGVASAQDSDKKDGEPGAPDPNAVVTGEVVLSLNSDYAKVRVDGAEWEEHEFLDNGKTLVIHTVNRTTEHQVSLTPIYPELAPIELVIKADDWKLAAISKTEKMWRVERKVVFSKTGTPAKGEPQPTGKPPKGK